MNEEITYQVMQACLDCGVREFILCAGSRNSSFVEALRVEERIHSYYWPEERSGAFFALGRSRLTNRPVAIVTTSGTAAGELLPATMEAHYSGVPLILITGDRPRRFRGSGAPQSAEQMHLFGQYTKLFLDVAPDTPCDLQQWDRQGPVHINVCLEEPQKQPKFQGRSLRMDQHLPSPLNFDALEASDQLHKFLNEVKHPLAIVSTLKPENREAVAQLLLKLNMPAMIESISGLRDDPRLQSLSLRRTDKVLETAAACGYPIDGILRIGGIPTHRIWRDLEYLENTVKVCALSEQPFSGLSWTREVIRAPIAAMLQGYHPQKTFDPSASEAWLAYERQFEGQLLELFAQEPLSEPALVHSLSKVMAADAHIYLGNSLPIREWDMAAIREGARLMTATRGVNGIDGQISAFLGLCRPDRDNWGIFGDLTTLYDMAGCWILEQLGPLPINIVVINNGGGKLFERLYSFKEMLNLHQLSFRPLAEMWGFEYACWKEIPDKKQKASKNFIEIIPNEASTKRFWTKYAGMEATQKCAVKS